MEEINRQKREKGTFRRGELPERFTARKLFRWSDKQYDPEYWGSVITLRSNSGYNFK